MFCNDCRVGRFLNNPNIIHPFLIYPYHTNITATIKLNICSDNINQMFILPVKKKKKNELFRML